MRRRNLLSKRKGKMNFIPSQLSSSAQQSIPIQKVLLVGHTAFPVTADSSSVVNHWSTYLQVSEERSVRVDMQTQGEPGLKDKNGFLGTLLVQKLEYLISNQAVKCIEVGKETSFTLKDVISEIEAKGYQNYDFNKKGLGCRYWVTKVLKLLKDKGLISSISEVLDALPKAWDSNGQLPHSKSVEKGTFH